MINLDVFEIKIKLTDGKNRTLAIVSLETDSIALKGFRVMPSMFIHEKTGSALALVAPRFSFKNGVAVVFKEKLVWRNLEDRVIERYLVLEKARSKKTNKEDW